MRRLCFVIAMAVMAGTVHAGDSSRIGVKDISGVLKQAKEKAETLSLPENPQTDAAREAAERVVRQFRSPEYQARLQREQERLKQEVFKDYLAASGDKPDRKQDSGQPDGQLSATERVYLFFSSSVPMDTLHSYMDLIEKAHDPNVIMVMRGFVGGMKKAKPTLEYLTSLLKKDPDCDFGKKKCEAYRVNIQINPMLFRKYAVNRVPTVIYAFGLSPESGLGNDTATGRAYIIEGDAGLDYLLERINREAKRKSLDSLVRVMRSGNH
ncbi:hypothetical protein GF1_16410 [Desulfolithobacter dissulfuricans]|uniref:Type-F conjugative transfer system pilin assembly protein TrbC n=1 Tax=Desulfolithobacter dissulfuricans TaxID=2795293 RepID=A0A915XIK4_9BACT|nr:type-F conjugative transfer system pilin assembly protein TrbC [Desulfolithobacter dissulfuricans]BCO09265.1 hypothetical protein GF1_16410 [Desulfolithobacter dissulfuricans]